MPITRDEFNQRVEQFLAENKYKNMESFCSKHKGDTPKEGSEPYAFFTDPIIKGYLSREDITFENRHPKLERASSESVLNDEYELMIYNCWGTLFIFRNKEISTDQFYLQGNWACNINRAVYNELFTSIPGVEVGPVREIYDILKDARGRALPATLKETTANFLIHSNWDREHTTTYCTILDPETKRALVTVFINSWSNEKYTKSQENCIEVSFPVKIDENAPKIQRYFEQHFKIDLKKPENLLTEKKYFKIIPSERAALFIGADEQFKKESLETYNSCETIYTISSDEHSKSGIGLFQEHAPKTPFIDASHKIQLAKDDGNCTLYSYNFIKAILAYLENDYFAQNLLYLASKINQDPTNKTAISELQRIFQEDLKSFLPFYYQENGLPRSDEERTIFHLQQRWSLSAEWFNINFKRKVETTLQTVQAAPRASFSMQIFSALMDVVGIDNLARILAALNVNNVKKVAGMGALVSAGLFAHRAFQSNPSTQECLENDAVALHM